MQNISQGLPRSSIERDAIVVAAAAARIGLGGFFVYGAGDAASEESAGEGEAADAGADNGD
jgi:hypothetical protein